MICISRSSLCHFLLKKIAWKLLPRSKECPNGDGEGIFE